MLLFRRAPMRFELYEQAIVELILNIRRKPSNFLYE
jgi:hypothetical protein